MPRPMITTGLFWRQRRRGGAWEGKTYEGERSGGNARVSLTGQQTLFGNARGACFAMPVWSLRASLVHVTVAPGGFTRAIYTYAEDSDDAP